MKVGIRGNTVAIIYIEEEDFYKSRDEISFLAEDFLCADNVSTLTGNTDIFEFPSSSEALGFVAEVSTRYKIKEFVHDYE